MHDQFIRAILSDKNIATDYFQAYLPPSISRHLDFSTLTHLPDSYLSEELQKTMSDIVYECNKKDGKRQLKVSLLIEHKSYPNKHTHPDRQLHLFCPAKTGCQQRAAKHCDTHTALSWVG